MSQKPSIMVVDDNEGILRMMRIVLGRTYEVRGFSEPKAALDAALTSKPDVVVLDVKMPKLDGFWLFRELREHSLDMPVIFNSAYQDIHEPDDLKHLVRPFAYLHKDGDLRAFLSTISKAVETSHEAQKTT